MTIAILGTFGANCAANAGPQRVSRALAIALFQSGLKADLFELGIPTSLFDRLCLADETKVALPGLPTIQVITPRQSAVLAKGKYTVVHFLGTLGLYTAPLLFQLRYRGIPSLATLNGLFAVERRFGYPYSLMDVLGEKVGLLLVDQCVAVSEAFRLQVERSSPTLRGRVDVIEHGFDSQEQQTAQSDVRRSGLLSIGGTRTVKCIPFLLSATERLLERGIDVKLVIAGPPGADHSAVMQAVERLQPSVTYIGELPPDAVGRLYDQCSVYVQPSRYEPYGIAVLEAMAHGAPVVVTRECGVADRVVNGENGFIVDFGDVETLADKILRLLGDAHLRTTMGRAAVSATRPWTWARASERYRIIYERLEAKVRSCN
jgi:glycosyltransferase involved in cell wall biosynthesis